MPTYMLHQDDRVRIPSRTLHLSAWQARTGQPVRLRTEVDGVPDRSAYHESPRMTVLPAPARRMLVTLAHCPGDHMDARSLAQVARAGTPAQASAALDRLRRWRLVQQPIADRFALHAVVRYALAGKGTIPAERYFDHYVRLLERHPERFALE